MEREVSGGAIVTTTERPAALALPGKYLIVDVSRSRIAVLLKTPGIELHCLQKRSLTQTVLMFKIELQPF